MNEILENQAIVKRHRRFFFLLRRMKKMLHGGGYLCAALLLITGIGFGIARSPIFYLQHIEITGDFKNIALEEIKRSAQVEEGTNLFRIPLGRVEKNIARLRWVHSVFVRRQMPHSHWITVKEYKPKAILLSDKLYFVSDEGKVFKEVEQEGMRDLPVLTGFEKQDSFKEVLSLIDFFESKLDFSVFGLSEIHYNDAIGFSAVTLTGPIEIKLGRENLEAKLNRFKTIWAYLKKKAGPIRGVDLDYEDKAFVKL